MLSSTEGKIIKGTAVAALLGTPLSLMGYGHYLISKLNAALIKGIQEHDTALVRQIVPRMKITSLGKYIWYALYNDNIESLRLLLERGASPDQTTGLYFRHGTTPLCTAMTLDKFEAAHLLLEYGANPAALNARGVSPLFYAYKNKEVAEKMRKKLRLDERESKAQIERHWAHSLNKHLRKQPPQHKFFIPR